ncbi:hypothetical protein CGQ11_26980 [Pseudomonas aeruginosa]|nr:hypothetical protein F7O89_19465 [Pseudomonas aeruginosa]MBK3907126.1 hypothetical protein [Pseudomonas aeruginosa]MCO2437194.1 hypothetical protein [Pseudomonas aeruginosa]MCO3313132.1 hypothetical protein [Pseudomonas aeruginosa]OKS13794.1 hypothetical protein BH606_22780 [Pseudomonas aeruginosa]
MRLPPGPAGRRAGATLHCAAAAAAAAVGGDGGGRSEGFGVEGRTQVAKAKRGGLSGRTTGGLRKGGHDGH